MAVRALFLTTYWIGSWVVDGTYYMTSMSAFIYPKRDAVLAPTEQATLRRKRRARGRNAAKTCARGSFGGFRNYHRPAVAGIAAHDLR